MAIPTKGKAQVLERVDTIKENFFLVGFRENSPDNPVLLRTNVIEMPGRSSDPGKSGIPHIVDQVMVDEPAISESQSIKERLIYQIQRLVSGKRLTNRELEVLKLVANGYANKQVAYKLNISERTVKNYMSSIMRKLEANSRAHAVVLAIRQRWVSP